MNKKIIKRIVLIGLVAVMGFVYIGYNDGLFDGLFLKKGPDAAAGASVNVAGSPDNNKSNNPSTGEAGPGSDAEESQPENNGVESLVSIVQSNKKDASDIDYEEIRQMVRSSIQMAGGLKGLVKDNQTVVLKPNLVQMHVDSTGEPLDKLVNGVTTDYRVVKAVVEVVRELNPNGKVYVMEGSGGDKTEKTMKHLNYTKEFIPGVDEFIAIEDDSGLWQDFNSPNLVKVDVPNGLLHKQYYLNKKYYECDVLISIPCLKTNSGTVVSGSIKNVSIGATPANIYGVSKDNTDRSKMVSHKITDGKLDKWVYDYYMARPVDFVVMDGLQGFQNGPVPIGRANIINDRMNMRLMMAGRDSVVMDTVEALIVGWDPRAISYLVNLNKSGMGETDTSRIRVVGKNVDDVRKPFLIRFSNLGGVKIRDFEPPKASIKNEASNGNIVQYELEADSDTVKVEAYVDDKYVKTIYPQDFKKFSINKGNGKNVRLVAFDVFLNHRDILENAH